MATSKTTDSDFTADVLQSDKPVLVDFWAEWCGPCKAIGPALEEIAGEKLDSLSIVKLNIDENPLTPISESVYDFYAFGVFKMQGWLILGFAPLCWLINFFATGGTRILPWRQPKLAAD